MAKENQNDELNAFIFGSITHNILDATLHPYIVYKTGIDNHTKERLKYRGLHTLIETKYDMFNYQRYYQKTILHHNVKNEFFKSFGVKKETINSINEVFQKMYQFDGGKYLFYGYKCARSIVNMGTVTGFSPSYAYTFWKQSSDFSNVFYMGPCYKCPSDTMGFQKKGKYYVSVSTQARVDVYLNQLIF